MTRDEHLADFFFSGAKTLGFTALAGMLTAATGGKFVGLDADGKFWLIIIVVGLGLLAIVLLVAGWTLAPSAKEISGKNLQSTGDGGSLGRFAGADIVLFPSLAEHPEDRDRLESMEIVLRTRPSGDAEARVRIH